MAAPIKLSDDVFDDEIGKHQGLAVVDFWATWCGPCHMIAPIIEQLADEYEGRVKVGKVDVDANQRTAMRYNVRSIPTVLLFKDGELVESVVGAVPKAHLEEKIKTHLE